MEQFCGRHRLQRYALTAPNKLKLHKMICLLAYYSYSDSVGRTTHCYFTLLQSERTTMPFFNVLIVLKLSSQCTSLWSNQRTCVSAHNGQLFVPVVSSIFHVNATCLHIWIHTYFYCFFFLYLKKKCPVDVYFHGLWIFLCRKFYFCIRF